jgi:uncharacterized protein YggE
MIRFSLALALLLGLFASLAQAQEPPPRRPIVSVTGTGEVQLKPDFARLHASVVTQGDTVQQTVDANRAATERVLARLQAVGVRREDIQTTNLQVSQTPPRVDRDGREVRAPRFTATHQLRVTSRDLEGVGKLAGEMLSVGDLTFQALVWGLDRQDEGRDEARRAAVRDARRQAEIYTGAAEVKLGRLVEIRDAAAHAYGDAEVAMRAATPSAPGVPVVPPASVRATASVQMVWEIEPR